MLTPRPQGPKGRRAFVGRDAELAALAELVSPAAAPRRFAVVTGAPGSGCTALLRAVSEVAAARGTAVLAAFSITDARRPYGTMLAPLLDPAPGSAAYPGISGISARRLHDLARQAEREPIDHLPGLVEGYGSAVDALVGPQPMVVIIDDVQAADAESLRILPLLARRLTNSRWIVATHVHGETHLPARSAVGDLLDNALPDDTLHVPLRPLTDTDLAALVRQTVGLRPGSQLISSLAHHLGSAAGLPGPVFRFVATQRAARRIRKIDSLDHLVDPAEPAVLSVEDPLVVALGGVSGDTALVVSVIAALGRAEPGTLLDVADVQGTDPVGLSQRIDRLVDLGLLSLDNRSRLRLAVPALAHTLLQHTPGQAGLHRRLASSLLARGGPGSTQETHRLADHLSLASATSHGTAQGGSSGGAGAWDLPAPLVTLGILATAIRSASGDVDPVRTRRWARTLSHVLACLSEGEDDDAGAATVDSAVLGTLADVVARIRRLGYPADAVAIGLGALALVTAHPDTDVPRDAISVATAMSLAERGELSEAERLLAGVDLNRLADPELLAQAARLLTMTGRPEQARHLLTRLGPTAHPVLVAERVALEAAWGDSRHWADAWTAWRAAGSGRPDIDGEAIRERACLGTGEVVRAMLMGVLGERPDMDSHEAQVTGAWLGGDWDEVIDRAGRLAACSTTTAAPAQAMELARALAAEVWLQRGEPRRGLRWVRAVPDNRAGVPVVAWALSGTLYADGEPATAQAHLTGAIARCVRSERLPGLDLLLARLVDQRFEMGDMAGAHHAARQLREVADALGSRQAGLLTLSAQARLGGDPDAAEAALALAAAAGMRFQRARLHLLCGQLGRDPTSHLHEALRLFHTLGAQPWTQQVGTELRQRGDAVPRQRGPSSDLTSVEAEIADLVAAGLGNRRIAARLRLSEKTIEGALTRILTKTGCRNRVDLAVRHQPRNIRHR